MHCIPIVYASRWLVVLWAAVTFAGCQPAKEQQHIDGIEITLTDANFTEEVLQSEIPVLVDFGATWCGPCQYMEPIVATLSNDFDGRAKVGKLDVDESPNTSNEYDIEGIPAILIFKDGKEVARVVGTESYRKLADLLESFVDAAPSASL